MNEELAEFLHQNRACSVAIARLSFLGAETLEQAWEKAAPADLVWGVTRPGVMSPEQRRQFLVFVLESIEDKLTDARSKNILEKLRTNSPITRADAWSADAADAAAASASVADADAVAVAVADAACAAACAADAAAADADAAQAAAWAAWAVAAEEEDAVYAAADAARAAYESARAAACAASRAADVSASREKQAKWIRENVKLSDLHIN